MIKKVSKERFIACLVGGAIGDALGAPVEFMSVDEIEALYGESGITGYVEFNDGHGEFTDDTQMTLFTAEALLRAFHRANLKGIGGALLSIGHMSYLRWLLTQGIHFDKAGIVYHDSIETGWMINQEILHRRRAPGNTCISALRSGIAGTTENPVNNSKGCGTIMRMAPVGLMFAGDNKNAFTNGCELAAITHGHPTGYLAAGFFASVIADLAVDKPLREAIHNAAGILHTWPHYEETLKAVNKALILHEEMKKGLTKISNRLVSNLGLGWIAEEALSISLFTSLVYEHDFKNGILFSVNHSGDSDSTGSITGNILGLINGIESIPGEWISRLHGNELVREVAEDLHTGIKGNIYQADEEWLKKYPGF